MTDVTVHRSMTGQLREKGTPSVARCLFYCGPANRGLEQDVHMEEGSMVYSMSPAVYSKNAKYCFTPTKFTAAACLGLELHANKSDLQISGVLACVRMYHYSSIDSFHSSDHTHGAL